MNRNRKFHLGSSDPIAVAMWLLIFALLVLPVAFAFLVATAGAAVGFVGAVA